MSPAEIKEVLLQDPTARDALGAAFAAFSAFPGALQLTIDDITEIEAWSENLEMGREAGVAYRTGEVHWLALGRLKSGKAFLMRQGWITLADSKDELIEALTDSERRQLLPSTDFVIDIEARASGTPNSAAYAAVNELVRGGGQ